MSVTTSPHNYHNQPVFRTLVALGLWSLSCASMAVTPVESNYLLGLDVQGQRLNLYHGCAEGSVTCDDIILVAQDLTGWAFRDRTPSKRLPRPLPVVSYSAQTHHSTCKDGKSPCRFQGYGFFNEQIDGFIDPSANILYLTNKLTQQKVELTYKEQPVYLPLTSQASLVDSIYQSSDKEINDSYQSTRREIAKLYGYESASELKKDQIQWILQRSKYCGADTHHQPRSQAEKVCFIQQNINRLDDYFLWID